VELQVEKDPEAEARELVDCLRTLRCKELAADLEQTCRAPKPACQSAGRPQAVDIQGDD
jgi:hypothetical protein